MCPSAKTHDPFLLPWRAVKQTPSYVSKAERVVNVEIACFHGVAMSLANKRVHLSSDVNEARTLEAEARTLEIKAEATAEAIQFWPSKL